ncbi:MAG: energy transducer TonB [Fluviicola sp.]|nr:energy transducer TonB [Fluviicola sp.]
MKIVTNVLFLLFFAFTVSAQDTIIYGTPNIDPAYPGGMDSLKAFLARTIVYPKMTLEEGIEGNVYLVFTVANDGAISNIIVRRGIAGCSECDAEAVRAVSLMPKWIPGKLGSKNVENQVMLPIGFSISKYRETQSPNEKVFAPNEVEELPLFPGGRSELMQYLATNLYYPQRAIEAGLEGVCWIQFMVTEDGAITKPKIMRGVVDCPECDQEAIRVIKLMPKWTPGKISGKAVNSLYNQPITFKMN